MGLKWWEPYMPLKLLLFAAATAAMMLSLITPAAASVAYDHKAVIINGQRRILISGSIHYPRSTPEMWPNLIQQAKDGGLDVIQTYVFWNGHEPSPGQYYFEDRYDLVRFIKLVQQVWLKYVPGIQFRTDNEPFKIENEFGPLEWDQGQPAKTYAAWAAQMAVGLDTGVPWIMCKEDDAPDPVINTWNGFYGDYCQINLTSLPCLQKFGGWFTGFGGPVPHRPVEDLAFAVAKFIQKGGSFVNYYMYHGGTNFGRTAGGPFIATSYDYDAPIDEFGLLRQPKWGHLRDLHKSIKLCESALISGDPVVASLGNFQESHVYRSVYGDCAAFLANYDTKSYARVAFNGMLYDLLPWSISILPDCKTTVFNTARVGVQTSLMQMKPIGGFSWQSYADDTNFEDDKSFSIVGLLEQINVTRDTTDYLWHCIWWFEGSKATFTGAVKLWKKCDFDLKCSCRTSLTLSGLNEGQRYLTWQKWTYQIGLKGEALSLHTLSGSSSVEWGDAYPKQPLTCPSSMRPVGNDPLAIDMSSMGRGNWGKWTEYWEILASLYCNRRLQSMYHIPRSWINPTGNLLVLFEEWVGDPASISMVTRNTGNICSYVSELQPSVVHWRNKGYNNSKVHLSCEPGKKMTNIKFASFGIPKGTCGSFSEGTCHAQKSYEVFEKRCLGHESCSVSVASEVFGTDPCPGEIKASAVEAICG
ncbi:hypothetical protein HPP92_008921 [Vanilla planifolia]|uniref:beta-galactosidase n=1 Tax=Vanilla planifolia TaxID=51239 RepID=A0A835RCV4_VANPL|nr:hypothetical protein HPP92_008921 [Vanilla planifolia]